ncbi:MAG: TetR/AcrR family transcriptional regulator [Saprospiraceae bacterium]|nr:TetR/AcrR family transcriptional regulator [Saprospiraceae bacterium]
MRYKEYNTNRVLEKCITLFCDKGFNGCSVNEIVETTGVNRFSLYHEFTNKEGILYQTLNLYKDRHTDDKFSILKSDGDLVTVLKTFYLAFLKETNPLLGCYFIHIGTELADSDPRVKKSVDDFLSHINDLFYNLLIRNNFNKDDAGLKARHLLGLYCTTMSFRLIHTPEERENYTLNGIKLILS